MFFFNTNIMQKINKIKKKNDNIIYNTNKSIVIMIYEQLL